MRPRLQRRLLARISPRIVRGLSGGGAEIAPPVEVQTAEPNAHFGKGQAGPDTADVFQHARGLPLPLRPPLRMDVGPDAGRPSPHGFGRMDVAARDVAQNPAAPGRDGNELLSRAPSAALVVLPVQIRPRGTPPLPGADGHGVRLRPSPGICVRERSPDLSGADAVQRSSEYVLSLVRRGHFGDM